VITFRTVVKQALAQALKKAGDDVKALPDLLAVELRAHFRRHGYVVKATAEALELGRPMTEDEQRAVGLIPLDGDVPGEGLRSSDGDEGLVGASEDPPDAGLPPAGRRNKSRVRNGPIRHHQRRGGTT
jgi:hypothetical protein